MVSLIQRLDRIQRGMAMAVWGLGFIFGPILAFCITTLSLGAGLSVARYRLYDVERVVTDSSAYALSTGAVVPTLVELARPAGSDSAPATDLPAVTLVSSVPLGPPPRA